MIFLSLNYFICEIEDKNATINRNHGRDDDNFLEAPGPIQVSELSLSVLFSCLAQKIGCHTAGTAMCKWHLPKGCKVCGLLDLGIAEAQHLPPEELAIQRFSELNGGAFLPLLTVALRYWGHFSHTSHRNLKVGFVTYILSWVCLLYAMFSMFMTFQNSYTGIQLC